MSYWDDFVRLFKPDPLSDQGRRISNPYYYYTDTHPSEEQYARQQAIKNIPVIGDYYDAYMKGKSLDEYNANLRKMYNIDFDDITYPWLSNVLSYNASNAIYSAAWQFSSNMKKLYR